MSKSKFSQELRSFISANYKNVKDFSEKSGLPYGTIYNWFRGHRVPSIDALMRLRTMGFDGFELVGKKVSDYVSDELDVKEVGASYYVKTESSERQSREDALSSFKVNQNDDNFAYVNLVDIEASAGNGALIHSEEIEDRYAFNKRWLKSKGLVNAELSVIKVSGFSMNPTIPDASMILVKLGVPPVEGKIGLILSKGELFIKRLRLVQDKWCGVSDNPDFSLVNIDEESAIIGLAVSLMSDL